MAIIEGPPQRSRMPQTPNVRVGGGSMITPDDLGSQNYKNWMRLGQTIGLAGQAHTEWADRRFEDEAQAEAAGGINTAMTARGKERNRLTTLKGSEAVNTPRMYEEYAKKQDNDILSSLKSERAKEIYQRRMMDYDQQNSISIDAYVLQESERDRQTKLEAMKDAELNNAMLNAGNQYALIDAIGRTRQYNAELYRGQPQEFIDQKNRESDALIAENVAKTLAADAGPMAALEFMSSANVKAIGSGALAVKFGKMRKEFLGMAEADAKKESANSSRQLGIRIADEYEGDYSDVDLYIENKLRDVDKDIADIARVEAKRMTDARKLAGLPAESRERLDQARSIAAAATKRSEVQDRVAAVPGLTTAEHDKMLSDSLAYFDTLQAERKEEVSEAEATTSRIEGTAVGKRAKDKQEARDIINEMDGIKENVRKSMTETAYAEIDVRQMREARERADLETKAMQTMRDADWSPSAIDPSWPPELQDKMRELSVQNRKPDPVKSLEFAQMTPAQLQRMVREGKWPEMEIILGNKNSLQYGVVMEKIYRHDGDPEPMQDAMQDAKTQFAAKGIDKDLEPKFIEQYDKRMQEVAEEQGLESVAKVKIKDRKQIINDLLEGDGVDPSEQAAYDFQNWLRRAPYFGRLVPNPAKPKGNYNFSKEMPPETKIPGIPNFVAPHMKPGDQLEYLMPDGDAVVSNNGAQWIITKSGKRMKADN